MAHIHPLLKLICFVSLVSTSYPLRCLVMTYRPIYDLYFISYMQCLAPQTHACSCYVGTREKFPFFCMLAHENMQFDMSVGSERAIVCKCIFIHITTGLLLLLLP